MQTARWWLPVLGAGMMACGGRTAGDPGTPNDPMGGTTTSGDSTSSNSTSTGSTGSAGSDMGGGGSVSSSGTTGAGGSAGGPSTAAHDGGGGNPTYFGFDAAVTVDVTKVGGAACGGIEYPANGFYGENILYPPYSWVTPGAQIEMAAKLGPVAAVRIKMTLISGSVWYIGGLSADWRTTQFDFNTGVQIFQAPDPGRTVEITFTFIGSGRALLEYFECGSATPNGTKLILWGNGISDSGAP